MAETQFQPHVCKHKLQSSTPMLEESTDNDQKKMISRNSSTKEEFVKVKEDYQASLNKSGYKKVIEFNLYTKKKKHRRNRIVTWFNPPWSDNVKTNIAEKSLQLIDKYHEKFKGTPLEKNFTRATMKVASQLNNHS